MVEGEPFLKLFKFYKRFNIMQENQEAEQGQEQQQNRRVYAIGIESSDHMNATDADGSGTTRWDKAKEYTTKLVEEAAKEGASVSVHLIGERVTNFTDVTPENLENIWKEHQPQGNTSDLSQFVNLLREAYTAERENKSTALAFVITSGMCTNAEAVNKEVAALTQVLNSDEQVRLVLLQVGNSNEARETFFNVVEQAEGEGFKYSVVEYRSYDELLEFTATGLIKDLVE